MRYGLVFWQAGAKKYLNSVALLNKRAIRIMNMSSKYDHTEPLFKRSHILKFEDLCNFELVKFIHNDLINANHFELFDHTVNHSYPTRNRTDLIPIQTNINVAYRFVTSLGILRYNSVPSYIKQTDNISDFKILYKNHVLSSYSN